jgi:hypothetical protein
MAVRVTLVTVQVGIGTLMIEPVLDVTTHTPRLKLFRRLLGR